MGFLASSFTDTNTLKIQQWGQYQGSIKYQLRMVNSPKKCNLLTLMFLFLLKTTKEDILKNIGNQTVSFTDNFHCIDKKNKH